MSQVFVKTAASLVAALALGVASFSSLAASSATSSVSDSLSTSVGSLSDSIKGSSNSSTGGNKVAAGDYKIIDVAAIPGQPGMVGMTLQAAVAQHGQAAAEFTLVLPQQALDKSRLAQGQTVSAREHAYGLEFAVAATQQAFFLVLRDEWFKELQSNPVTL